MVLHDFECPVCKVHFERVLKMKDVDNPQRCPECSSISNKVFVLGHGGIQRKDSTWVRGVAEVLSDSDRPLNISTVEGLRAYYAQNPKVVPKESHPAFPSSLGDGVSRPDAAYIADQRRKRGEEVLRKHRAISI